MQSLTPSRFLFAIARGDAFGGSSLHVMDMAERLEGEGHTVRILVGGTEDMEVPRRFAARNLDFVCIPNLNREVHLINDLKAAATIRREFNRFHPDLVSLHSSKAGAVGRIALLGKSVPQLYTPHCWAFVAGFPRAGIYRLLEKCLAPLSTRIVAVSEDERQFALKNGVGNANQIITIHNGVRDSSEGSTPSPLQEGAPVRIIMVGRFEGQKNQALLLRALSKVEKDKWALTFIGEGPLLADCKALASDLNISDRVDFSGYSNQVPQEIKKANLFALITNWEGFPRSILEAMSMSLPVLTSDVGGCRESVTNDINGRIVDPNSEDDLIEALEFLLSDPDRLSGMGAESRARFEREFTFDAMAGKYLRLYQTLIGAPESANSSAKFGPDSLHCS